MSVIQLSKILSDSAKDDALVRHFLGIWPVIESILEAFSKATKLPTFVFFNDIHIFTSSLETMPPFCCCMLNSTETARLCIADGQRRAASEEPINENGIQMCHAGMLNGRRRIEAGIGTLTILFGSKKSIESKGVGRREQLIQLVSTQNASLAGQLEEVAGPDSSTGEFESSDIALMDAITDIVQSLINATAGFRLLTINMAHELSLMMINLGMLTRTALDLLKSYKDKPLSGDLANKIIDTQEVVDMQCRLGLYIVRNFLSHTSETRYNEVVNARFQQINLETLLNETIKLYRLAAAEKKVTFETHFSDLPSIRGVGMELRRLFSNIINNAIKYSYHSVPNAQRIIRVKSKVPYDPGFTNHPRFAITFENYGLGLTEEERRNVFKPGFRGKQAIAEVPIGSGIGLSEASKIIKLHKGHIKIQSKELYRDDGEMGTYLTIVDLIFPYEPEKFQR